MATFLTSQIISRYYSEFQTTELTFTKDIIKTLALDPRQVYIKCSGSQWPCIINSASFSLARVMVGVKGGAYQAVSQGDSPAVNIRFAFYQSDGQLMSFFISGKVTSVTPYANNPDLAIVTVTYNQRPPDDMIEMMGRLLDAMQNSQKRKNDRIVITPDSLRKLGIPRKETVVVLQNVPRHCILQELTFGGAKVVLLGIAQFLMNKDVLLRLEFDDPHETIPLQGTVTGTLPVEGRKDIVVVNIQFTEQGTPLAYKIHINNYLTTVLKKDMNTVFAGDAGASGSAPQTAPVAKTAPASGTAAGTATPSGTATPTGTANAGQAAVNQQAPQTAPSANASAPVNAGASANANASVNANAGAATAQTPQAQETK